MTKQLRTRFWVEVIAGAAALVFAVLTLLWKEWIEIIFGVDPDHGSGALEWMIVLVALAIAVSCSVLGRREWRRVAVAG